MTTSPLLTASEAAARCGLHRSTVYAALARDAFLVPTLRVGDRVYVSRAALDAALGDQERQREAARQEQAAARDATLLRLLARVGEATGGVQRATADLYRYLASTATDAVVTEATLRPASSGGTWNWHSEGGNTDGRQTVAPPNATGIHRLATERRAPRSGGATADGGPDDRDALGTGPHPVRATTTEKRRSSR